MKLNEVLTKTIQFFKDKKIETARLDAELLVAHALQIPRIQLYVRYDSPLNESEVNLCREYLKRRAQGEPVAYIVEEKGFFGLAFKVKPGVLIPRPETELIVEEVLNHIKLNPKEKIRILDLGAGTGCIGFSILKNCPEAELVSIEKSEIAMSVLKENCEQLELTSKVQMIHQDVDLVDFTQIGLFDYIVSNPPYIDQSDVEIEVNVKKFEPSEALFAKDQGLQCLKSWSQKAIPALKKDGLMLLEMGYKQGPVMLTHLKEFSSINSVEILKDLSGLDRIVKARS